MEVILLEKVNKLGNLGDCVHVKPGYGRNYLVPSGIAVPATKKNREEFEAKRAELEKIAKEKLAQAQIRAQAVVKNEYTITAKVSDEGKLYGSVGTSEIAKEISNHGVEIEKSEIRLPHGALRFIGEYDVEIQLHSDVMVTAKVHVVSE